MATHRQKIPQRQRQLEVVIKLATVFFLFSIFFPTVGSQEYIDSALMNSMVNLGKIALFIALGILILALKREMFFIIGMLVVILGSAYQIAMILFDVGYDSSIAVYVLAALLAFHFVQKNERRVRKGRK